jgi:hypothetical protein
MDDDYFSISDRVGRASSFYPIGSRYFYRPFHVDVVDVGRQQCSTYAETGSMHGHGRSFHVDVGVGSTWADALQMVHVHHDGWRKECPNDHDVHGHEEFRHHRFLPCEGGWMPRTQQHRGVDCGPWPDRSVVMPWWCTKKTDE